VTRADQVTRLRNYFENNIYFSTSDFTDSIQDGYDEIAAFTGVIMKGAVMPFVKDLTYYDMITIFPDFIGTFAIFNSVTKRWMSPTSMKKLDRHRIDWETAYGTPEFFSVCSHRYLALYRKPSADNYGNAYVFYIAAAPTLATDADLIQIPDDFTGVLDGYSITDLQEQQQEWNKAGGYLTEYIRDLEDLRNWAKSQRLPARMPTLGQNG
jgi:hypothetical protein